MKEESGRVGLKLNIQKMKIMASVPINLWEIDGGTVETVADFIFWAPISLQMVTAARKLKDACCFKEAMASHSNTLVWKIPWTEEPVGLQSMGSPRVGCKNCNFCKRLRI